MKNGNGNPRKEKDKKSRHTKEHAVTMEWRHDKIEAAHDNQYGLE